MNYKSTYLKSITLAIYVYILSCLCVGCISWTNPTPDPIHSDTISYDEFGNKTGGILGIDSDVKMFIITPGLRDRYNGLIDKYGKTFTPEVKKDFGISKYGKTEPIYGIDPNKVQLYYMTAQASGILDRMVTKDNAQQKYKLNNKK